MYMTHVVNYIITCRKYIITRSMIIFREDVKDALFHLKIIRSMRSIPRKLIISISRYIRSRCIDGEDASHGVTSFQLFALYFRGRCEVRKMRGWKNAKSTKCIAQHIPTQLRSFPTKIFPVNSREKARVRILHAFQARPLRVSTTTTTMTYRSVVIKMRLRLKNYTGLNLTDRGVGGGISWKVQSSYLIWFYREFVIMSRATFSTDLVIRNVTGSASWCSFGFMLL